MTARIMESSSSPFETFKFLLMGHTIASDRWEPVDLTKPPENVLGTTESLTIYWAILA
jgi:hypothetical protein